MKVVFDACVVFAGCGWRNESHQCLIAMARRWVFAYGTQETVDETRGLLLRKAAECRHSPWPIAEWYFGRLRLVDSAPLGKQRSRDRKDDPYLACALGAGASVIVSRDPDLLELGTPFGIAILTPRALLARLARPL